MTDKKFNEIIDKCKLIHNNFYSYELVKKPKFSTDYVTIICPIHGEFKQNLHEHSRGCGCQKCSNHYHYTTEEWIKKASLVHHNFYSYNKAVFTKCKNNIIVTCPIHGDFSIIAANHLQGCGCPICGRNKNILSQKSNKEKFIEKYQKKWSNNYILDDIVYVNSNTKIKVICPKHGDFYITPCHLLQGEGCPKCKNSILENIIENSLKKLNIEYFSQYKIDDNINIKSDFYLPSQNLLIECQGEQHFHSITPEKHCLDWHCLRTILKMMKN